MAYKKTEWKARQGVNLNRFRKSQETNNSVVLHNIPDLVTEPGTPFNTENMNKIEQGIYDAHETINNHTEATNNPHNVTAAQAGAEPARSTVSQAEAEAGTVTTVRGWTAQRVRQAINAVTNAISALINNHIAARDNPHQVTAAQAGAEPARAAMTQAQAEAGTDTTIRGVTAQRLRQAANALITSLRGAANGVAGLDSNARIPVSLLPDSVLGNVAYQGSWDAASNNNPTLGDVPTQAQMGHYWIVRTAGTRFGITFQVGDWIIADRGTNNVLRWAIVRNTDAVRTVRGANETEGRIGDIVISAANVGAEPARSTVSQAEAEAGTVTTVRGWTAQRVRQAINAVTNAISTLINNHIGATNNPHNVTAAQAGAEPVREAVPQAEAEAGTATTVRGWTAQRVRQAINAVVNAISNAFNAHNDDGTRHITADERAAWNSGNTQDLSIESRHIADGAVTQPKLNANVFGNLTSQGTAALGQGTQNGSATTAARSDHRHALPSAANVARDIAVRTINGQTTFPVYPLHGFLIAQSADNNNVLGNTIQLELRSVNPGVNIFQRGSGEGQLIGNISGWYTIVASAHIVSRCRRIVFLYRSS